MDIDEGDKLPVTEMSNVDTRINNKNQANALNTLAEQGKMASERLRYLIYDQNKGIVIY